MTRSSILQVEFTAVAGKFYMPLAHLNLSLDAKQIAENFFTIPSETFGNFDAADIHGDDAVLDLKNDKLASYFHCLAAVIAHVAYTWRISRYAVRLRPHTARA